MGNNGEAEGTGFGLEQVLSALGDDLRRASQRAAATGNPYGLVVQEAEIELSVTVTRERTTHGDAKLKFQVLPWLSGAEAGGGRSATSGDARVHTIRLRLGPPPGPDGQPTINVRPGTTGHSTGEATQVAVSPEQSMPFQQPVVERDPALQPGHWPDTARQPDHLPDVSGRPWSEHEPAPTQDHLTAGDPPTGPAGITNQ
ncbi:trypco2 family protein [Streptomyces sp. KL116D]|uniref:trypco2 family protein n=1 Tax=Streptomyces sp. KL116D TaxID=3045152 RepID=UPI003555D2F0